MADKRRTDQSWIQLAAFAGSASILCYFGAAFLPIPDALARLLVFSFGPLLGASMLGTYHFFREEKEGPILQLACLFGLIAGVLVTSMLVVQVGNNMVRSDLLSSAESVASKEAIDVGWSAVNRVQYLLDVVWDLFICSAIVLLGVVMLGHSRFGKLWGGVGIVAGVLLLILNLYSFPYPPGEAGAVDLGPLVALWMLAVYGRLIALLFSSGNNP